MIQAPTNRKMRYDEISIRPILRIGDSADVSRSKRIVSGWTPMEESNFFEDLKTGIVLCKVVERLDDCSRP